MNLSVLCVIEETFFTTIHVCTRYEVLGWLQRSAQISLIRQKKQVFTYIIAITLGCVHSMNKQNLLVLMASEPVPKPQIGSADPAVMDSEPVLELLREISQRLAEQNERLARLEDQPKQERGEYPEQLSPSIPMVIIEPSETIWRQEDQVAIVGKSDQNLPATQTFNK